MPTSEKRCPLCDAPMGREPYVCQPCWRRLGYARQVGLYEAAEDVVRLAGMHVEPEDIARHLGMHLWFTLRVLEEAA